MDNHLFRSGRSLARSSPFALVMAGAAAALAPGALAQTPGEPYCPGDGCPCGNEVADAGCGNQGADGDLATGALLTGSGSAILAQDDLVLTASRLPVDAPMLLFMGQPASSLQRGDGLICVGAGQGSVYRFGVAVADANGVASRTGIVQESQSFPGGAITVGSTWAFQAAYRDVGGPCGSSFNYTNGWKVTFEAAPQTAPERVELAGIPLSGAPWFERVDAINQGDDLFLSLDGTPLANAAGQTVDAYVVEARSAAEWAADDSLVDVRGASQAVTVSAGGAQMKIVQLDAGTLNGTAGTALGVAYDVVVDVDRDGVLGAGDLIDGLSDDPAVVVMRDFAAPGPYTSSDVLYPGGSFLRQKIYFPDNLDTLGEVPLVIVSHGNGHNYRWYNYIGEHLATYGYVVMSHENNTGPGIEAASLTTLRNTDHFLENLAIIDGGRFENHIDRHRIAWIGHSRGAEGIARAYKRLIDGDFVPTQYVPSDIRVLSSMAPTVFLGLNLTNPKGVPLHLWVGSADNDVTGSPSSLPTRSFVIHERAEAIRMATTVQGAGHAVFHDDGHGGRVANGPCQVTFAENHTIARAHFSVLMARFLRDEPGVQDFLTRPWQSIAPIGAPTGPCIVVNHEYRDGPLSGHLMVDDFQSNFEEALSSSGTDVRHNLPLIAEGRLIDANGSLADDPSDPFNGMTRIRGAIDTSRGLVLEWSGEGFLEFDLPASEMDLTDDQSLSFRACQRARHPSTIAALEDIVFDVTLVDDMGMTSSIRLDALQAGISEPYQRSGTGAGAGWSNEFEAVRIRLADFAADGNRLDLSNVTTVRFDFGLPGASPEGAIGFDELQILRR